MATVVAQRRTVAEEVAAAPLLVFFSSVSGNTARFAEKLETLGKRVVRIPLHATDAALPFTTPMNRAVSK